MAQLRRTRVGPFAAEDGLSPDSDEADARAKLLPPAAATAELPQVRADGRGVDLLRTGRTWKPADRLPDIGTEVAVLDQQGELVGVAVVGPAAVLRPERILPRS